MRSVLKAVGITLGTLGAVGVLGFGASQAWASSRNETSMLSCPPAAVGTCVDGADCQHQCDVIYGDNKASGQCNAGCCYCILL